MLTRLELSLSEAVLRTNSGGFQPEVADTREEQWLTWLTLRLQELVSEVSEAFSRVSTGGAITVGRGRGWVRLREDEWRRGIISLKRLTFSFSDRKILKLICSM